MTKVNNRVLLVSAVFPPQLGGTAEKMARRVKYFKRFGWQTVVLTPQFTPTSDIDNTLLQELEEVEIHSTAYFFSKRWPSLRHDKNRSFQVNRSRLKSLFDLTFVPKGYVRWIPSALRAGLKLIETVDVILTMNNPVTLHLIGYALHKLTGKPWVAEFRDPIVEYSYGVRGPEKLNYWLENLVVSNANAVIQRLDFYPELVSKRYPQMTSDKFVVIPYAGFDPDDFTTQQDAETNLSSGSALTIAYTGSFYGETITPIPFVNSLKKFLAERPIPPEQLQVVFAGDWDVSYDHLIQRQEVGDFIRHIGYLTYTDCIRLWKQSQVLLLILGKEEENRLRIPSKFWDYLGARRPILALVDPQGETARIIREQHLGFVADTEDENSIVKALHQIFEAQVSGNLQVNPDDCFYQRASRAYSEKMVVDVLEKVTQNSDDPMDIEVSDHNRLEDNMDTPV